MSTDENDLDFFLIQSLKLFSHIRPSRITWEYPIIEVASYQKEIRPVLKGKVNQDVERVLEVSFPLEPSRAILDGGGVEVVVGCEKHVYCHYPLSSQAARTVRLLVQPLGSILNLEANEPEAFPGIELDLSRERARDSRNSLEF
jgi:hypothetical protein